jgi:DNA-binding FadR family transcriptional regulator
LQARVPVDNDQRTEGAPATRRLTREKIALTLAQDILRDVAAQQLQPGDRLQSEADMLTHYGVARSSLREGLRILEVLGLIDIRTGPGGGPVVRQVSARDFARTSSFYLQANGMTMRELVQARLDLEPMLVANAARRRDPAIVERLRAANERAAAHLLADDASWADASLDFHRVVTGFSGNRVLDFLAGALSEIYQTRLKAAVVPMEGREGVHATHTAIAAAIAAGKPDKAERLMRAHMTDYAASVAERYPRVMDTVIDWA